MSEDLGRVKEEVVFASLGCTCMCKLGKWIVSGMKMGSGVWNGTKVCSMGIRLY